jgi:hypothetical protein
MANPGWVALTLYVAGLSPVNEYCPLASAVFVSGGLAPSTGSWAIVTRAPGAGSSLLPTASVLIVTFPKTAAVGAHDEDY